MSCTRHGCMRRRPRCQRRAASARWRISPGISTRAATRFRQARRRAYSAELDRDRPQSGHGPQRAPQRRRVCDDYELLPASDAKTILQLPIVIERMSCCPTMAGSAARVLHHARGVDSAVQLSRLQAPHSRPPGLVQDAAADLGGALPLAQGQRGQGQRGQGPAIRMFEVRTMKAIPKPLNVTRLATNSNTKRLRALEIMDDIRSVLVHPKVSVSIRKAMFQIDPHHTAPAHGKLLQPGDRAHLGPLLRMWKRAHKENQFRSTGAPGTPGLWAQIPVLMCRCVSSRYYKSDLCLYVHKYTCTCVNIHKLHFA